MVSFIDADPAKFKHEIELPGYLRMEAGQYLAGSGLRKGRDWVRGDGEIGGDDCYLLKSEGAAIAFRLWVTAQEKPAPYFLNLTRIAQSNFVIRVLPTEDTSAVCWIQDGSIQDA
jgi:hypothetical protein